MPFQVGSVAVHDDGQHTGSAKRNTASGVAGLDASSLQVDAQHSANIARAFAGFALTTLVFHGHDAQAQTQLTSYVKLKTITLTPFPAASLQIYFELNTSVASGETVYGTIYRNGSPVGTERSMTGTTWTAWTEYIAGWSAGDTLEMWLKVSSATYIGYVRNFRILYDAGGLMPNS